MLPPTPAEIEVMGRLIAEETERGIPVSTGGLLPSAAGARVHRKGSKVTVVDGPFTGTKELVGGFAVMQLATKAEAIDAAKRFIELAGDGVCEVRPFYGMGFTAREGLTLYMSLWRPVGYRVPTPEHIAEMNKLIEEETRRDGCSRPAASRRATPTRASAGTARR